MAIERTRSTNVLEHAAAGSPYDELPVLPPDVDPQVTISRNDRDQPFFLVCDHDTMLVHLAGTARVECRRSNAWSEPLGDGDFLYVPAGTPHRIVVSSPSVHVRFKAAEPAAEAVAWFCDVCHDEVARIEWDAAEVLPQEGYAAACERFNADDDLRRCRCGQVHEPVDTGGTRWAELAAELRDGEPAGAPTMTVLHQPAPEASAVPAPDGRRTVRRTNVFECLQTANTLLMPMFPYLGEGAMVPGANLMDAGYCGGPKAPLGRFHHLNSVDEVALVFAPAPGFLRVGTRMHPVSDPFEGEEDPVGCRVAVVTQRHRVGEAQSEACLLRCAACKHQLLRSDYSFHPADADEPDRIHAFATLPAHAEATEAFNADDRLRTCEKCGHVNEPFPTENWGWPAYTRQTASVQGALAAMRGTVATALAPAPTAGQPA